VPLSAQPKLETFRWIYLWPRRIGPSTSSVDSINSLRTHRLKYSVTKKSVFILRLCYQRLNSFCWSILPLNPVQEIRGLTPNCEAREVLSGLRHSAFLISFVKIIWRLISATIRANSLLTVGSLTKRFQNPMIGVIHIPPAYQEKWKRWFLGMKNQRKNSPIGPHIDGFYLRKIFSWEIRKIVLRLPFHWDPG